MIASLPILPVVTAPSRILGPVTALPLIVIAPVLAIVASPDNAAAVATLDPLPTKMLVSCRISLVVIALSTYWVVAIFVEASPAVAVVVVGLPSKFTLSAILALVTASLLSVIAPKRYLV